MKNSTIGSLSTKFLLLLTIAIGVPVWVMANTLLTQANATNINILESYLTARGEQQVRSIEANFSQSLLTLERFLLNDDFTTVLRLPLQPSSENTESEADAAASSELRRLFNERLVPSGYYNGLWLLTPDQDVLAFTRGPGAVDGIIPLARRSEIFNEVYSNSLNLAQSGQSQGVTLITGDDRVHMVSITVLDAADSTAEPLGFFIAELNLNQFVQPVLDAEVGSIPAYSFVLYPDNETTLVTRSFDGEVDSGSLGVQDAITNNTQAVSIYEVDFESRQREVIGYREPFRLADNDFTLVTEIATDATSAALTQALQVQVVPFIVLLIILMVVLVMIFNQIVVPPISDLVMAMQGVMRGEFDMPLRGTHRNDEIGELTKAFQEMRREIDRLTQATNRRLQDRTRDVQMIQDISETIINETNLDELLNQVVDLIVEKFPAVYHAQIFLLDQERTSAILRASTGESGQALLKRGHRLAVGSVSVIGQVTEQAQVITARDITESNVHRRNEFLPETKAELAIPLRWGGQVIGALDVQSKQRDSFDDDQIEALKTLADQITIAIENVRLYAEYQRLLATTEDNRRRQVRHAWQEAIRDQRQLTLTHSAGNETGYDFAALRKEAATTRQTAIGKPTNRNTIPFVIPLELQGEFLGVVEYEVTKLSFTKERVALAEELVNRLAISIENARLLHNNQQVANREQTVNRVSARLSEQTDMNAVLQIAQEEISRVLRTPHVAIKMRATSQSDDTAELPDHWHETPSS